MTEESNNTVARDENVFEDRTSPRRDPDARGPHGERIVGLEVEVKNIRDDMKNIRNEITNVTADIRDFRSERKWIIGAIATTTAFILIALAGGYFNLAEKIWKLGNLSGTPPTP